MFRDVAFSFWPPSVDRANARPGTTEGGLLMKLIESFHCPGCGKDTPKPLCEQKTIARFWSKVRKTDKCWIWVGQMQPPSFKYGRFMLKKRPLFAHRVSWEINNGPIPEGLYVLHSCDNPPCVNPSHLSVGTKKENSRQMVERGRGRHQIYRGEDHPNSKLSEENISDIRRLASDGMAKKEIGMRFGVSDTMVGYIVRRKSWGHI